MKKLLIILCLFTLPVYGAFLPPIYQESFSGTLPQTLDESLTIINDGFATTTFYIVVPTGGAVIVEGMIGGEWESASMRSIDTDTVTDEITADGFFIGSVVALESVRFRTSTGGSADGSVSGLLGRQMSTLEGIEFGWAPHKFGYVPVHVDASYSTAQTDAILFTADADKKSVVTDFYLVVSGSTDCDVKIFDETDSSGNYLFKASVEVATNKNFVFGHAFTTPYISSAAGNSWKLTTDANCQIDINGHGYQY